MARPSPLLAPVITAMRPWSVDRCIIQNTNAQMNELQILSPDGKSRNVPLEGERLSLGRSAAAELSFPDDGGLSRQHLCIERDGEGWAIRDLGSKNGTIVNGVRLSGRAPLKTGDRITAGHLILIYDNA